MRFNFAKLAIFWITFFALAVIGNSKTPIGQLECMLIALAVIICVEENKK